MRFSWKEKSKVTMAQSRGLTRCIRVHGLADQNKPTSYTAEYNQCTGQDIGVNLSFFPRVQIQITHYTVPIPATRSQAISSFITPFYLVIVITVLFLYTLLVLNFACRLGVEGPSSLFSNLSTASWISFFKARPSAPKSVKS